METKYTSPAELEFKELKAKTMQVHDLIKRLQKEAMCTMNYMEATSILTEVSLLREACYKDLDKLQMLGLHFMNKLQYVAVGQAIQKLKKEIE